MDASPALTRINARKGVSRGTLLTGAAALAVAILAGGAAFLATPHKAQAPAAKTTAASTPAASIPATPIAKASVVKSERTVRTKSTTVTTAPGVKPAPAVARRVHAASLVQPVGVARVVRRAGPTAAAERATPVPIAQPRALHITPVVAAPATANATAPLPTLVPAPAAPVQDGAVATVLTTPN